MRFPKSFTVNDDASTFIKKKEEITSVDEFQENVKSIATKLIRKIEKNLILSNETFVPIRGENNWYRFFSLTRERIQKPETESITDEDEIEDDDSYLIQKEILDELLIDHILIV